MAFNLDALVISIIVSTIFVSPTLWLSGRIVVGKGKFVDAVLTVVIGAVIGGILSYLAIIGLLALGVISAPGTIFLLILVGAGALITGLFAALLKTRSMNPDAGIGDTFVELASDTAEVIADGASKVINYVTEGVTNVYNTVADATKDNMADALAKLLEGDILGAITALITVIIIVAIIGISLVLVVFIAKALITKKVMDK